MSELNPIIARLGDAADAAADWLGTPSNTESVISAVEQLIDVVYAERAELQKLAARHAQTGHLVAAFRQWEIDRRCNPSKFKTIEEGLAVDVDAVAKEAAETLCDYLSLVMKGKSE